MLREGNRRIKEQFEMLLQGGRIRTPIDEQIVNNQLDHNESAIWSLLLVSGYESGFGRYDVVLEPKPPNTDDAFVLEFKVRNRRKEGSLEETVKVALRQIEEKHYAAKLVEHGIPREQIRCYEFAFEGKTVLIG